MQFTERHVLTVDEPSVVKKVLDAFAGVFKAGFQQADSKPAGDEGPVYGIIRRLHEPERLPGGRSSGPDRPGQPTLDASS